MQERPNRDALYATAERLGERELPGAMERVDHLARHAKVIGRFLDCDRRGDHAGVVTPLFVAVLFS